MFKTVSLRIFSDKSVPATITSWVLFWFICVGGTIYILPLFGANQYHKFYVTSLYFVLCTLVASFIYRTNEVFPHHINFFKQLSLIIGQSAVLMITAIIIDKSFPVSKEIENKILATQFLFPLFKYEVLITKFFDISFQQLMIFAVLKKLKNHNLSDKFAINYFTLAFFIIHLPLFFVFGLFSLYFIIPSLLAGIVFSFLILKYKFGLTKSFFIHYLFYIFIGLALRYGAL